jgi:hypothetical protein
VAVTFQKKEEDTLMTWCIPTFLIMSWQGDMRKVGTTFWQFFVSNLEMAHARNTVGKTRIHL